MARGPLTFRQRDVTAAVRAVRAAGCNVTRVEVGKDGRVIVVTGSPNVRAEADAATPDEKEGNEWDRD